MKICLISLNSLPAISREHQHLYSGGAEVQLAQLAIALSKLGHEVSLVVGDFGQPDGAIYEGVRTLKAFKPSGGIRGLRFFHPRWTGLWKAISRANADVYYYSCAGMILGLLAMFCRIHRKRLVFRAASDSDCSPHTLLDTNRRDRWLYEYGIRRTDAVLVQSRVQQEAMMSNFGARSTIVRGLIERPLHDSEFQPKDIDVLWVANMRHLKRPDRLIEIARALPQYRFHMVGGPVPDEEDFFHRVEEQARMVGNLTFHGKVPYLGVGRFFDRARLVANTSEVEGFPNTFLQAWVRGIPVVTMFDPDRLVTREALGTSHQTVPDMVSGIECLLEKVDAYKQVSTNALRFMEHKFGSDKVLAPYLGALIGPSPDMNSVRVPC
ncbi:MAG: glycosyltransferase family 4 protein [Burkholderiaceae bacterium]